LQIYASGGSSWIIDSGCTHHMTGEKKMFTSYVKNKDSQDLIIFGDGNQGKVKGLRKIAITSEHSISNVFLVESLGYNLVSQLLSGTIIRGTLKTPNSQLVTPISIKLQRPDGCD
jgi:hypothetical protein